MASPSNFIDLIGQKFNRLTVIKRVENSKDDRACWLCKCDCGNEIIVKGKDLRNGHTKSCGCLKRETSAKNMLKLGNKYSKINIKKAIEHNKKYKNLPYDKTQKRLFSIWYGMFNRCKNYENYKTKNIKVCEEWYDFRNFYYWSINNGFDISKEWFNCTIDRINNNGNYEPSNCRWVGMKTQSRNTSTNHIITWNNETHCISEWEEITNLPIRSRMKKGWSIEKIMNTPLSNNKNILN